ncbi:MAG: hypothetical protein KGJ13_11455 [Patescibacteria group bacterium]|nr:hypothetical protein [Patescibacteria group bacterium]
MKITAAQRTVIMKLWGRVCKDRGWKASDREFRLGKFGEIIGRPITSTDDIGRIDECTKLMKELSALLGVDVQAAREADDLTINRARVLFHQICGELVPCLELYIADVRGYLTAIMEDKNRWWKIDRPARDIKITDLTARPIRKWDFKTRSMKEFPSQLEQLQYTLAARLNTLRNQAGDSIHDMRTRAGLGCNCSKCISARNQSALQNPGEKSLADQAAAEEAAAEDAGDDACFEQEMHKEAQAFGDCPF